MAMIESSRRAKAWYEPAAWGGSAAILGGLLLAGRIVPIVSPDRSEWTVLVVLLIVAVAFVGTLILLLVAVAATLHGRRAASYALLIGLAALGTCFIPLSPALRDLDEHLHRAAREDIVKRYQSGELSRLSSAGDTLAVVPREYPWAVSSCGGHNLVALTADALSSRVMFCAHGGIRNGRWWVVYDTADRPPAVTDRGLIGFGFDHVERLRPHWYRVVGH
jgi:hypothetical protein